MLNIAKVHDGESGAFIYYMDEMNEDVCRAFLLRLFLLQGKSGYL